MLPMENGKAFDQAHAAAWAAIKVGDFEEARNQLQIMRNNTFQNRASSREAIEKIESSITLFEGGSDANR